MKIEFTITKSELTEAVRLYVSKRQNLNLTQNIEIHIDNELNCKVKAELQNRTTNTSTMQGREY